MSDRLHGLDLIRLVSFFAIATFHVSLIHYHTADIAIAGESVIIRATEQISRVLAFSGFTICFLSSLLTAFSGSSLTKRIRLFAFLIIGWAVFSGLMVAPEDTLFVWDIYPLIFTGVLLCSIIQLYSEKGLRVAGILGFILLCIPVWEFRSMVHLPGAMQSVMGFGECPTDLVEWPVLPWIGLVSFGYWVGNELRVRWQDRRTSFFRIEKKEMIGWGLLLGVSTLRFGDYYGINLGQAFTCEAYRQPPIVWWSHFIWPLFLIRLSFEPRIQAALARWRFAHFVSNLAISRKFWLAYFANYCFCYVLSAIVSSSGVEQTAWNVPVIAFIAVFLVPMTEILVRGILAGAVKLKSWFKPPQFVVPGQSGASLLMVMMTVVTIAAMAGGITFLVKNRVDSRILNQSVSGRNFAFDQLAINGSSPEALRSAAKTNVLMYNCINKANCSTTVPATVADLQQFELAVPFEGSKGPVLVASSNTGNAGTRYDWRGIRGCITGVAEVCMYSGHAYWWAECPNRAPSCANGADRIFVIPRLRRLAASKVKKRAAQAVEQDVFPTDAQVLADLQAAKLGKPLKFGVSARTSDIRGDNVIQKCPKGMLVTGTLADGTVNCECDHGYRQKINPANGQPVKDAATGWVQCEYVDNCVPPKILIGIDEKGKAKCAEPEEENYICGITQEVQSNGTVACASGERIRQLLFDDDCLVVPKGAPEKDQHVDCGAMKFRCCKLRPK